VEDEHEEQRRLALHAMLDATTQQEKTQASEAYYNGCSIPVQRPRMTPRTNVQRAGYRRQLRPDSDAVNES